MGISGGKLKIGSRRITTPIHVLRGIIKNEQHRSFINQKADQPGNCKRKPQIELKLQRLL
jgi:hypothetical protein